MHICRATQDHLAAIEALYRDVAEEMRGTDHDVWWEFGAYPTSEGLKTAMQEKSLFVAQEFDGRAASCRDCFRGDSATSVIGAFVLDNRQPEDYVLAPWRVEASLARVAVLHLLAVSPRARGRGVARGLLRFAADQARKRKAWTLRLDVFDNNEPAIACYESFGFVDVGSFDIDAGDGLRHASHLMELDLRDERRGCPPLG